MTRKRGLSDTPNAATLRLRDCNATSDDKRPLFTVPAALVRILDRDLLAAAIDKRDERGRTLDVHALRHSFGTLLSAKGEFFAAETPAELEVDFATYYDEATCRDFDEHAVSWEALRERGFPNPYYVLELDASELRGAS